MEDIKHSAARLSETEGPFSSRGLPKKKRILIADDSDMNRAILADMLEEEYEIVEARNGVEAIACLRRQGTDIDLVLLDIVMPEMDGFDVLKAMNQSGLIEDVPVIMISSEDEPDAVERAYEMGVVDYIRRPFDALFVHRRVVNTIMLYGKQKRLAGMVADQIYEREKSGSLMIAILSHIVEFRNGESGFHVLHINAMTDILLRQLVKITDRYPLTQADINLISTASALHDIGKISIPGRILNKPGRLTPEEFEIMKTHSSVGAQMLRELPFYQNEPLIRVSYEICRWHHERYDGRGYPDGLVGEQIPISAQIVALADVYDALTGERVYKKAFDHDTAIRMILGGECGAFNPLLLECLMQVADTVRDGLGLISLQQTSKREMSSVVEELELYKELSSSERIFEQMEYERTKSDFLMHSSDDPVFEYMSDTGMITFSDAGARLFGLRELTVMPDKEPSLLALMSEEERARVVRAIGETAPDQPEGTCALLLNIGGRRRPARLSYRAVHSSGHEGRLTGVIGKIHLEKQEADDER
ncbi:MAG: response regulator [Clostridia bacterium]|nr:response regulator [Clostridia bacterium]